MLRKLRMSAVLVCFMVAVYHVTMKWHTRFLKVAGDDLDDGWASGPRGFIDSAVIWSSLRGVNNTRRTSTDNSSTTRGLQSMAGSDQGHCWLPSNENESSRCSCLPKTLIGYAKPRIDEAISKFSLSKIAYHYTPEDCLSRQEVIVIIPFRDRMLHLKILIRHLSGLLVRQKISHRILVVQQVYPAVFNKASLMNAAFLYARQRWNTSPASSSSASSSSPTQCFVFHDVDMLAENDLNVYRCHQFKVNHLAVFVDKFNYTTLYKDLIGGVLAFTPEQFVKVNGYSNKYYGWGMEDDDMAVRLKTVGLDIYRNHPNITRYTMIHHKPDRFNPYIRRNAPVYEDIASVQKDGISDLQFSLRQVIEYDKMTMINVKLPSISNKQELEFKKIIALNNL